MALAGFNSDPNTTSSFAPRPAYGGSPKSNQGGPNTEPGTHGGPFASITSVNTATPIEVTSTAHPFVTNDVVRISGVNPADNRSDHVANGTWTITKTGADTFTLNTSVGTVAGFGGNALKYSPSTEQQFQTFAESASARSEQTAALTGTIDYLPAYQGDQGLVVSFEEGSAQSFHAGDLLVLSAGKAVLATSPTLGTETILGFAMKDATGTATVPCDIRVPRPTDTFVGNFAVDETFSLSVSPGSTVGLSQSAPGVWVLDSDGDPVVQLLSSQQSNEFGYAPTAGGRIYFKFI